MEFDIFNVYDSSKIDKLKIGSRGYFFDDLYKLTEPSIIGEDILADKQDNYYETFLTKNSDTWYRYFYLLEEPKGDKYRPFKSCDEVETILKFGDRVVRTECPEDKLYYIGCEREIDGHLRFLGLGGVSEDELLEDYTAFNGRPLGIKENYEEEHFRPFKDFKEMFDRGITKDTILTDALANGDCTYEIESFDNSKQLIGVKSREESGHNYTGFIGLVEAFEKFCYYDEFGAITPFGVDLEDPYYKPFKDIGDAFNHGITMETRLTDIYQGGIFEIVKFDTANNTLTIISDDSDDPYPVKTMNISSMFEKYCYYDKKGMKRRFGVDRGEEY